MTGLMIHVGCGAVVVLAREFDNAMTLIDPEPHPDGDLVRLGDTPMDQEPTVVYGEPVDDRPRYRKHDCGRAQEAREVHLLLAAIAAADGWISGGAEPSVAMANLRKVRAEVMTRLGIKP